MTMQDRFYEYDKANPLVWELFVKFAMQAINAGMPVLSSNFIFERIRWETTVVTSGDPFKVNNNYRPYYARKFMAKFPSSPVKFKTRETWA